MIDETILHVIRHAEFLIYLIIPAVIIHLISAVAKIPADKVVFRRIATAMYLLAAVGFAFAIWDVFICARVKARDITCEENLQALGRALTTYSSDWDNTFPPASKWYDAAQTHMQSDMKGQIIRCPASRYQFTYALNAAVGGTSENKVNTPAETVMIFECDATGPNACGNKDCITPERRHYGRLNFTYMDGHANSINMASSNSKMIWKP